MKRFTKEPHLDRDTVLPGIYILIFGSIFSWSIAMLKSDPNMGDFGLIHSLSPFYWMALLMLLGSFLLALKGQNKKIYFTIILTLIIFLFLTPAIIEETARFRSSYKVHGYEDYINRNGHIDSQVIWYHNWPGVFLFTSMLSMIINVNNDFFFMYFPFIIQIIYFFPIHTFLRSLLNDDKKVWIGIWIFYILNFINQDYMSPQAFAYLFFLILLSIIVQIGKMGKDKDYNNNISLKLVAIILFSSLVFIHMMTSMVILLVLFFSALSSNSNSKKDLYKFTIISITIFTFWTIYGAYNYLSLHLFEYITKSFDMDLMFSQNIQQRVSGSPAHLIISKLMVFTTLISIIFAVIGIIISYYKKDKISLINKKMLVIVAAICILSLVSPYGGEMVVRVFLFILPLLSFFISQIFVTKKKVILILFLAVMTPLFIITHYGNEKYDYVSKAEFTSYNFFYDKIDSANIVGGYPSYAYKFPERYNYLDFKDMEWDGKEYISKTGQNYNIMISRGDKVQYEMFYDNTTFVSDIEQNLKNSENYITVYSSGDLVLYENMKNIQK